MKVKYDKILQQLREVDESVTDSNIDFTGAELNDILVYDGNKFVPNSITIPAVSGSTFYIQNQFTSAQTTSEAWLSGRFQAGNLRLSGNTITSENTDGNIVLSPNGNGGVIIQNTLTILDAKNIILGTTTGTKIGTTTSQKISLWNANPDIQPTTSITPATFITNTSGITDDSATFGGYTIGQIVAALKRIGALA